MRVRTVAYNHPGMVKANALGLAPCADHLNNVNRRCSLPGDKISRLWTVETPLRLSSGGSTRFYIVRNWQTGEYRVTYMGTMGNLY